MSNATTHRSFYFLLLLFLFFLSCSVPKDPVPGCCRQNATETAAGNTISSSHNTDIFDVTQAKSYLTTSTDYLITFNPLSFQWNKRLWLSASICFCKLCLTPPSVCHHSSGFTVFCQVAFGLLHFLFPGQLRATLANLYTSMILKATPDGYHTLSRFNQVILRCIKATLFNKAPAFSYYSSFYTPCYTLLWLARTDNNNEKICCAQHCCPSLRNSFGIYIGNAIMKEQHNTLPPLQPEWHTTA